MKIKRISLVTILLCLLMVNTTWASQLSWETAPGNHEPSILLDESILSDKDSVYRLGRGEFLAEGSVQITNRQNGDIYVCIDTYAYRTVDKIFHTLFLEYWSEDENDWIQVGYWEFERTAEDEADGELTALNTAFTLTGYKTGLYYRVRGLHGVELNGETEACSSRTDGVLITKN